jgi:hypothetical protein
MFMIFRAANTKELSSGGSVCGLHSGGTWVIFDRDIDIPDSVFAWLYHLK